jgi:hypothetical protein
VNGATGAAIDVAKAAVNTAQVALDGVTKQQNQLVVNAHANLLNSTIQAQSEGDVSILPPVITGIYNKGSEGIITLSVYQTGNGLSASISGIISGTLTVSTNNPQALGDTGLFVKFPSTSSYSGTVWDIEIPNKNAANYLTNYNAYQSALQNQSQAIASAQATLNQANASLLQLETAARPEDVAAAAAQVDNALGAVQIAQAAYDNTIITAPSDGTIMSISIAPGQIAVPNAGAIEFTSLTN